MGKCCDPSSASIFDRVLAGYEDMHERLNEFKFYIDTTTESGVICPCASEKMIYNVVNTLAPPFFIKSSSNLQVKRTYIAYRMIAYRMSSKLGQIGPRTVELADLEHLEKSP